MTNKGEFFVTISIQGDGNLVRVYVRECPDLIAATAWYENVKRTLEGYA